MPDPFIEVYASPSQSVNGSHRHRGGYTWIAVDGRVALTAPNARHKAARRSWNSSAAAPLPTCTRTRRVAARCWPGSGPLGGKPSAEKDLADAAPPEGDPPVQIREYRWPTGRVPFDSAEFPDPLDRIVAKTTRLAASPLRWW